VDLDSFGPPACAPAERCTSRCRSSLEQHLGVFGVRVVVKVVLSEALAGQPALAAFSDLDHEIFDVIRAGWKHSDEVEAPLLVLVPGSVGDQAM